MCQRSCAVPAAVTDAAKNLEGKFQAWAKALEPKGEGRTLPPEAVMDWLRRAGIADGKGMSEADLKAALDKIGSKVSMDQLGGLLNDLATQGSTAVNDLKEKLSKVEPPK